MVLEELQPGAESALRAYAATLREASRVLNSVPCISTPEVILRMNTRWERNKERLRRLYPEADWATLNDLDWRLE